MKQMTKLLEWFNDCGVHVGAAYLHLLTGYWLVRVAGHEVYCRDRTEAEGLLRLHHASVIQESGDLHD